MRKKILVREYIPCHVSFLLYPFWPPERKGCIGAEEAKVPPQVFLHEYSCAQVGSGRERRSEDGRRSASQNPLEGTLDHGRI